MVVEVIAAAVVGGELAVAGMFVGVLVAGWHRERCISCQIDAAQEHRDG